MNDKYCFDGKEFRKHFLPKIILGWAIIPLTLNMLAILNSTWSFALFVIVGAFTVPPLFGIYFHQKMQWKSAFVTVCDSHITYFRIAKDGYDTDSSVYEYMAKETIISKPMQYRISESNIRFYGHFAEQIYKDQDHQQVETKQTNSVKIPLYFERHNELIDAIRQFN